MIRVIEVIGPSPVPWPLKVGPESLLCIRAALRSITGCFQPRPWNAVVNAADSRNGVGAGARQLAAANAERANSSRCHHRPCWRGPTSHLIPNAGVSFFLADSRRISISRPLVLVVREARTVSRVSCAFIAHAPGCLSPCGSLVGARGVRLCSVRAKRAKYARYVYGRLLG